MNHDRRRLLGAGAAAALLLGASGRAFATMGDVDAAIASFGGDAEPTEGALKLIAPEIAENGNSVPISFTVDSPMTEDAYVESVMLLASDNPAAEVATFHFTPRSGKATASTRMRLAKTQDVVAVAKLSDGSLLRASSNVKVTIGGCGG